MPCHIWRHWQHLSIYYWSSIYIFLNFFLYISCPGGSVKTLVILQKNIWSKKVNLHTYSSEWQWKSQLNLKLAILQLNFPHILRQLFEHFIKKRSNFNEYYVLRKSLQDYLIIKWHHCWHGCSGEGIRTERFRQIILRLQFLGLESQSLNRSRHLMYTY